MDALQAVEKDCQKNLNKYVDGLIEHVQTLKNDLNEGKKKKLISFKFFRNICKFPITLI